MEQSTTNNGKYTVVASILALIGGMAAVIAPMRYGILDTMERVTKLEDKQFLGRIDVLDERLRNILANEDRFRQEAEAHLRELDEKLQTEIRAQASLRDEIRVSLEGKVAQTNEDRDTLRMRARDLELAVTRLKPHDP